MKDGTKKTNTCQNIPRLSTKAKENSLEYQMLCQIFAPVFKWLHKKVDIFNVYLFKAKLYLCPII